MTNKTYSEIRIEVEPGVRLGPRTRREIELQIRQLEGRLHPTMKDHAELARLRELVKTGGDDAQRS